MCNYANCSITISRGTRSLRHARAKLEWGLVACSQQVLGTCRVLISGGRSGRKWVGSTGRLCLDKEEHTLMPSTMAFICRFGEEILVPDSDYVLDYLIEI